MKKVDPTVLKETVNVGVYTVIFSVLMQAFFLVAGEWDYTVLLGNLLGVLSAVGNFFLMGLSIQSALEKEEKEAKDLIKLSQRLRMFMLIAVAAIGYFVPIFNLIAVVIPWLFPRVAVTIRGFTIKQQEK